MTRVHSLLLQQQQPSVWKCHVHAVRFSSLRVKIQICVPPGGSCLSSISSLLLFFKFAHKFSHNFALFFFRPRLIADPAPVWFSPAHPFVCYQVIALAAHVSSTSENIVSDTYNNNSLISFSKSKGVHMKVQHNFLAFTWFFLLFFCLPPREGEFQSVNFSLL